MIYPLVYVLLGKVFGTIERRKWLVSLLCIYSITTYYYFYPNLIAYSNELIADKKNAYKIMGDSNLDFGQAYYLAKNYISRHPDTRFADTIPSAGKQLLRVNDYLDLESKHKYDWLKQYKPSGHVTHSYLLFDIKQSDIEKK